MKKHILVAEDDPISRRSTIAILSKDGYRIVEAVNGTEAWGILEQPESPKLAIIDWMMPGLDGLDLCRGLSDRVDGRLVYVILLTAKGERNDVVTGLEAGADDYMIKPFHAEELRARVRAGFRILELQEGLSKRVGELEQALIQIKKLQGLLPICSYCKKIRDDGNYWHQVEEYISHHSEVKFSHGICPNCFDKEMAPQLLALKKGLTT
ncbi:MAG: response regulator [Nitrospirota bacterium]|nr:response regulator [Nitrospirota bacterium]